MFSNGSRHNNVLYAQMRKTQVEKAVVIDAEDTGVVVLAAYASHTIKGKLGIRRKGMFCRNSPNNCSFTCQQWCRCGLRILWPWKENTVAKSNEIRTCSNSFKRYITLYFLKPCPRSCDFSFYSLCIFS